MTLDRLPAVHHANNTQLSEAGRQAGRPASLACVCVKQEGLRSPISVCWGERERAPREKRGEKRRYNRETTCTWLSSLQWSPDNWIPFAGVSLLLAGSLFRAAPQGVDHLRIKLLNEVRQDTGECRDTRSGDQTCNRPYSRARM